MPTGNAARTIAFAFQTTHGGVSQAVFSYGDVAAATQIVLIGLTSGNLLGVSSSFGPLGIPTTTSGTTYAGTGSALNDGNTHGVVVRIVPGTGTVWTVYLDGAKIYDSGVQIPTYTVTTGGLLVIGDAFYAFSHYFFTGSVGQVAVWESDLGDSAALTLSAALQAGTSQPYTGYASGMKGYWTGGTITNGVAFNPLADASGNGLTLSYPFGATVVPCSVSLPTLTLKIQAIGGGGSGGQGTASNDGGGGGGGGGYSQTDDGTGTLISIPVLAGSCYLQVGVAGGSQGNAFTPGSADTYMAVPVISMTSWSAAVDPDSGDTSVTFNASNYFVGGQLVNVRTPTFYYTGCFISAASSTSFTVSLQDHSNFYRTFDDAAGSLLQVEWVVYASGGMSAYTSSNGHGGEDMSYGWGDWAGLSQHDAGDGGRSPNPAYHAGNGGGSAASPLHAGYNGQNGTLVDAGGGGGLLVDTFSSRGSGYTTSNYRSLYATSGSGAGMQVNTVASGGGVTGIWQSVPGSGYAVGDTITVSGGSHDATFTLMGTGHGGAGGNYAGKPFSGTNNGNWSSSSMTLTVSTAAWATNTLVGTNNWTIHGHTYSCISNTATTATMSGTSQDANAINYTWSVTPVLATTPATAGSFPGGGGGGGGAGSLAGANGANGWLLVSWAAAVTGKVMIGSPFIDSTKFIQSV